METHRIEATVQTDGKITISGLPFGAGETVEVVIRNRERSRVPGDRYPLRGQPVRYVDPFEGVAEDEWDAMR